jgi:hypothetical protein
MAPMDKARSASLALMNPDTSSSINPLAAFECPLVKSWPKSKIAAINPRNEEMKKKTESLGFYG